MAVINRVEADQRHEQSPVRFGHPIAEQIAAVCQPRIQFVERLEQSRRRPLVRFLATGEPCQINAVVHPLVNCLVERIDFLDEIRRSEVVIVRREIRELAVEHSQQVVVRVADDPFCFRVPKHWHRHAAAIIRIGRVIGFAEELKSVDRIVGMSRPIAERPAALVANGIDDGDSDRFFESFEFAKNNCAMRPRAGERDVKMITTALRFVRR